MHFNSFQIEAQRIVAGFHTGRSLNVSDSYLTDPGVFLHESMHNRIFTETKDGYLHLGILTLTDNTNDSVAYKSLSRISNRLFKDTMLAHERVATFLGIQALPTSESISKARYALPISYKEYYSFFDQITSCVSSSFVAFDVAWAIGWVAFNSSRIDMIDDLSSLLSGSFLAIPGPTNRIDKIRDALLAIGQDGLLHQIDKSFKEIFSRDDQEAFDTTDDEQWKVRSASQNGQLTDRLFIQKMEIFVTSLLEEEWTKRVKIPSCFEGKGLTTPPFREFEHDFPFENGVQKLSPEAIKHYTRAADFNSIYRDSAGMGLEIYNVEVFNTYHQWFNKLTTDEINITIIEEQSDEPNYYIYCVAFSGQKENRFEFNPFVCDKEKINYLLCLIYEVFKSSPVKPSVCFVSTIVLRKDNSHMFPSDLISIIPDQPCKTVNRMPRPTELRLSFFLYARDIWSGILALQRGKLCIVAADFKEEDRDELKTVQICVFFPEDDTHHPYIALMTQWSYHTYNSLVQKRISEGCLELSPVQDVSEDIRAMLTAIWQTYKRL